MKTPPQTPIALVGLSALFPGSADVAEFWRDVIEAKDRIGEVPPTHWLIEDYYDPDPAAPDKTYCRRGGFLAPIPFDPMEFGIPPNALPATDSAQLLALMAAKRALEDASRTRHAHVDPDRISVILGVASTTELVVAMGSRLQAPVWRKALREAGLPESEVSDIVTRIASEYVPWQESTFPGLLGNVVAGRIANRLNLGGMNCVIDAACASSLAAVELAIKELELGDSDIVVTGGVDALNDIMMFMCFSKTPAFSPTGDCRPFSDQADGTIIGEGVGILALRRLADAERDGDSIYAVIRGLGASSDGRASSVYAPRAEGQAKALRRAYAKASYGPETVELVEAHGTGTKAGDAAEFEGLKSVFATDEPDRKQWCALGSIKSQIGHTKAAAGSAGLIKAALALNEKILPPTLKVERPNPALKVEASPFYLNTKARPWIRAPEHKRRASVSSFGFGGSNFHVTLEEYAGPNRAPRLRVFPEELVLLSAASKSDLAKSAEAMARGMAPLALAAHECASAFDAKAPARLALVAASREELSRLAARAAEALRSDKLDELRDPDILFGFGTAEGGATAFLFPGQGSQYVGMGAAPAMAFDAARAPWDAAAGLLMFADLALHDAAFPAAAFDTNTQQGQVRRLTEMVNAQPAIAAMSLGLLGVLDVVGIRAEAVAGHSFGEVTALAASGVFEREALVQIARRRGELMTDAARDVEGAMLACSLDGRTVREILGPAARDIVIANDNAPNQIVLAGTMSAIGAAEDRLKAAGKTGYRLPVATAFHSPLVAPSCEPFRDYLNRIDLGAPRIPVYSNTTGEPYPSAPAAIARLLAEQLARPVQFRAMVERMYADGVRRFIEVGPGRVLTGLVDQCLADRPHLAVALDDRKVGGLRGLWRGLGRLAAAGVTLDLSALFRAYAPPATPRMPAKHAVMISGANLGRPYPPQGGAGALPPPNPERAESGWREPSEPSARRLSPDIVSSPAQAGDPDAAAPGSLDGRVEPSHDEPWVGRVGSTPGQPPFVGSQRQNLPELERIHRETFDAQRAYQETMARSHQAFLALAERAIAQMAGGPGVAAMPLAQQSERVERAAAEPAVMPVPPPGNWESQRAQPALGLAPARAPAIDPARLLIEIVAEKTGYPAEMLGLDLELEAGLGIDSIKQVEILSAVQERLPGMGEIAPTELARLKTLNDIIARIKEAGATAVTEPTSARKATVASAPSPPRAPADATDLLLDIVAEKTGYPKDMLALDQEMEAGLGIDSIKQVEILSALRERLPGLPEIAPAELGALKTLRDVGRRLNEAAHGPAAPPPHGRRDAPEGPASQVSVAPAPAPAAAPLGLGAPVLVAAPRQDFDMTARRPGEVIYLTDEAPALARAVAAQLTARGRRAEIVDRIPRAASAAICFAALGAKDAASGLAAHLAALSAARTIAGHPNAEERLFATVQSAGGFGLAEDPGDAAWAAGVSGIGKTAAHEWPGAGVKAIDIANPADAERAGALIADELLAGGAELEVAFARDGARSVVRLAPELAAPNIGLPLAPGSVILVSGGARGVTARCAEALAAAGGYRLVLIGRTALRAGDGELGATEDQPRLVKLLAARAQSRGEMVDLARLRAEARALASANAARAQLARLAASGVEARYLAADVRDTGALAPGLAEVRADWGPIGGIMHGAGILADKRIADLTDDQFTEVFATKVGGLRALLEATRGDPLRIIAIFSSIAARYGNAGQAAYAAANEVLNKVAAHEAHTRGAACRVRAYNWGAWDGGMVDAALKAHFERRGAALIGLDEGAAFFVEDMAAARPTELVAAAPSVPPLLARAGHFAFDPAREPSLLDHQIRGRIVVPVVHVLDRALRLAQAMPNCGVRARLQDVRVFGGVTFAEGEAARLRVQAVPFVPGDLKLEITFTDGAGRARYRAIADFPGERSSFYPAAPDAGPRPWPLDATKAYGGPLFHGPRWRAIKALHWISPAGGEAALLTARDLGWPQDARAIDPALIDGGLQLALLWTHAQKGFLALPQRIAEFEVHRLPGPGEEIFCRFSARPVTGARVDFDLAFLSGDEIVANLLGAEFIAYEP